jgi:hypothetical protein
MSVDNNTILIRNIVVIASDRVLVRDSSIEARPEQLYNLRSLC